MTINKQQLNLILASQSPRRAELLNSAGYQFTVFAPEESVEAQAKLDLPPDRLVIQLAMLKAQHVAARLQDILSRDSSTTVAYLDPELPTTILAADTVAHCHGEVLGKPSSRADAQRMLRLMSGKLHEVLTGCCLWHLESDTHREFLEVTRLRMDRLSDDQIEEFLESGQWQGKAGAFGYQDGLDWVHIEQGLASNVVGLPVERLAEWLA
jgi:septum formation protein